MGEKPNEMDEGRGSAAGAVADVDQDGLSDEKKAGPRTGEEQGKTQAQDNGGPQHRAQPAGQTDPTPASIAIGDEGAVEEKKGSRAGLTAAGGGGSEPAEAANLNSSKSNIERTAGSDGAPDPSRASNLNLSKSNIDRAAASGTTDPGPGPDEATNLNSSRSN